MLGKIKSVVELTTDIYLQKHLSKIPGDKKQIVINDYNNDIERIANYILNSGVFNEKFVFSEDFIKLFHKIFYPENFIQKGIDENGKEVVWMIPGEYKKIDNFAETKEKENFFSDLPGWSIEKDQYTKVEFIEKEMKNLIENFNKAYIENHDKNMKKDLVFLFFIDIVGVHPFADGNGKIISILLDLYLIKIGFKPLGLKTVAEKDKLNMDRMIFLTRDQRNPAYIYDYIEKYS